MALITNLAIMASYLPVIPPVVRTLLLRGQGANGSTSLVDEATTPHTVNVVGDVRISTAQARFGSSSIYFSGTNQARLSVAHAADLNLGTSNFTLEGWLYPTTSNQYRAIMSKRQDESRQESFLLILFDDNTLRLFVSQDGGGWNLFSNVNFGSVPANAWTHFALSRQGANWYCFLNGSLATTLSSSSGVSATTNPLLIGSDSDKIPYTGHGHFRITPACLYTASFTPPASF